MITFDTEPARYQHWRLEIAGTIATLTLDVSEDAGLKPGYKLKRNSYDLGVDIELYDALNRIRFEHPGVGVVVLASGQERIFCAGANIYMLGSSTHAFKVNFCKFTNETRNGMEDSSRYSGLKFLAAVSGSCAGGGYELALACDDIVMIDDRSTTVSLPEVALLGVLPGTGGLTRLVDKRKVRRDLADMFCTSADGIRAARAREWRLVDDIAPPQRFAALVQERANTLAGTGARPAASEGIKLAPLERKIDENGYHYRWIDVRFNRPARIVTLTVGGPTENGPRDLSSIVKRGADWWPLAMARELDDAILMLRTNEPELGTVVLKTRGNLDAVLANDALMLAQAEHWFVRETIGLLRRTLQRLDVTSRSFFAVIDRDSCFAGTLFELALAADRSYMLDLAGGDGQPPRIALSAANFGLFPMDNGLSRLATRFCGEAAPVEALRARQDQPLAAAEALSAGLVTQTPDALDWNDEIRVALEERASLSPDALTGLEASLRFAGPETMTTRIFARLTAWQNWVFSRPNAVGEAGALKRFGSGARAQFDWERV